MKKLIYVVAACFIIASIALVIYGKMHLKHVNFNLFATESEYKNSFDFDAINVQTTINNIDHIEDNVNDILVVTVESNPEMKGNGIIDQCRINQVISSDHFKEGDKVQIYQFILDWRMVGTDYFGGSTPLKPDQKYLVFIKKAPNPNKKNTYIYSTIPYGHIMLDAPLKIMVDDPLSSILGREYPV